MSLWRTPVKAIRHSRSVPCFVRQQLPAMNRFILLALLSASVAHGQTFPAPGTGVFSWERVSNRPLGTESFAFAPDGRLYAGRDTLYVLEPGEGGSPHGQWRILGQPDGVIPITNALFVLDPVGDTLFSGRASTIRRSIDSGGTWLDVHGGVGGQIGGPNTPDGFFALPPGHPHAGRLLAGGGILHSDDRGATWAEATRLPPFPGDGGYAHVFAALPSGRVLAAGNWGVAASDDGGASVATTPIWGDFRFAVDGLAPLATPGSAQTGAPACGLPEPVLCDGAVAVGIDATAPHVRAWRTSDGGRSWSEPVPLPEPADGVGTSLTAGVVALSPGPDGLGRAITIGGRGIVRRTDDGGQTWAVIGRMPVRLGGASHFTRLLRLGPDGHLWVSTTMNGPEREWLYRSVEPAEAAFVVAGESAPAGEGVRLDVRPNPSAGGVAVRLTLPAPTASVVASVVDALGRRVGVLHDGPLSAGAHELALTASALAPGVYVVQVRVRPEGGAAAWTAVRRVTVTR